VSGNAMSAYGEFRRENNQRKIFLNETRYLSIDKPNVLQFPTSRMDHLLWKNINDLGESPNIIDDSTTIKQYNQMYNGQSLFHYFVQNSEVIEVMHNKYMNLKDNNILSQDDKYMPLVLLNPDYNGKTAIELAVDRQRPKPFELMINLLAQFDDLCFTKMMMNCLPKMLS
jgi:hypothetical protein